MSANLQMDMGELIAFLKTGKTPTGETSFFPYIWLRNIGVAGVAVGVALAWYKFYYVQQTEKLAELREEYAAYDDKASAMPQMEANISRMEGFIANEKAQHVAALDKFYGNESIDAAYETVSDVAKRTEMTVKSIMAGDVGRETKEALAPEGAAKKIAVEPIPVKVTLKGSYANFLRFVEEMRTAEQIYAVGAETVQLSKDERNFGFIEADVTLVAYAIEKNEMTSYLPAAPEDAAEQKEK